MKYVIHLNSPIKCIMFVISDVSGLAAEKVRRAGAKRV